MKLVEIEEDDEISLSQTPYTIDSIEANIDSISPEWTHNCVVKGEIVQFKLDTGSQVDILPESVCKKLNLKVEESPVKLRSYSDHTITPIGQTNVEINTGKCRIAATFQVVRGQKAPLLGKDTCEKTGLLKRVYNVSSDASSTVKSAKAQMDINQNLFEGLGCLRGREYDIEIDPEVKPVQLPPQTGTLQDQR